MYCILSAAEMWPTVCGFWRYKAYADIRRGSPVRWCQMRVRSSKMRVFSFDRYIFSMKFPTGFTCRNLHGFAPFPCDSTALVQILEQIRRELVANPIHTADASKLDR